MHKKNTVIAILLICIISITYITINLLSYKNALLFSKNLSVSENIIHQEWNDNTLLSISYEDDKENTTIIRVCYFKRDGWGVGESQVHLNYDRNMLYLYSFSNSNYRTFVKNTNLLELYDSPAFGSLGYLRWYSKRSLLGVITSYTEIIFGLNEDIDIQTLKKNGNSFITIE